MIDMVAYTDFWYWVNERHRIFLKKEGGEPKPWSPDPIFQKNKFCNPFRTNDKQSRWLIENVLKPHNEDSPGDILFNIYAFRAFNLYRTFDWITGGNNWFDHETPFYPDKVEMLANMLIMNGRSITSGAYMIRGREGMPKQQSICMTLQRIWEERELVVSLLDRHQMEHAFKVLIGRRYWGWADFTTYQVVLDLTYTPILEYPSDINMWCAFGPGAKRGLREIWPDLKLSQEMMIAACQHLLRDQVKYLEPYVPQMNLQDIEFSLCELQKYRRCKAGGRAKEGYPGI